MRSITNLSPFADQLKALILVPHDSTNDFFFDEFPEIRAEAQRRNKLEQFEQFIHIESDKGALVIADQIAKKIQSALASHEKVELIHLDYPRGIIDGGRKLSHCVRDLCTTESLAKYEKRFKEIHQLTMDWITQKIEELNNNDGLLLDIHTMAPWSPSQSVPLHWDQLYDYVESFTGTYSAERMRPVNLLTRDDDDVLLADQELIDLFVQRLEGLNFSVQENEPYRLSNPFANHHYLSLATGIAIDIPKHLLAEETTHIEDFPLNEFRISEEKVKRMGNAIAEATLERLNT